MRSLLAIVREHFRPSSSRGNTERPERPERPERSERLPNPPRGNAPDATPCAVPNAVASNELPSNASDPDPHNHDQGEWRPPYPRLTAFHDCLSLAAGWSLGLATTSFDDKPTGKTLLGTKLSSPSGASQAQSPCEDDSGDGKCNELLASCPAFRNELGCEPTRRLALSRHTADGAFEAHECETWMREHTAAEVCILEDVSNVYLGGRLCAARQPKTLIEPQDIGSYYYRHCFAGRPHVEYLGVDDELGPVAISMVKESSDKKPDRSGGTTYRMIIRISDNRTMRISVPEEALPENTDRQTRSLMRELIELACPRISFGCLRPSIGSPKVEEMLMKIDEQPIYTRYKVGILLCKAGQSTEEQMYNNEESSPAFDEFLDFIGTKVKLKGWENYKGGLDTRGETTGSHSVYIEYQAHEIMFHVSTLLPFTPQNKQQLSRKRHIGNDMVTIIFQEPGAQAFSPITVRSHFQHVFIIVRVSNPCTENVSYRYLDWLDKTKEFSVAVSRSKEVPPFGPPVPNGATFSKCSDFHDWILTKIINAENAVHRSKKFATMAARTRREALRDLVENYVGPHQNEGPSRIASRFLGGSVKRKDKVSHRPDMVNMRGALSWAVDVNDYSTNQRVSCILGASQDSLVLFEKPTGVALFTTPTHSIIGWAISDIGMKLYYDHGEMILLRCCAEASSDVELASLVQRMTTVTKGDEAKELIIRRVKNAESWGFHVQEEGIVTDVEMYQMAWKAGLRQGSRIVEIDGELVATMTMDKINQRLGDDDCLRFLVISPGPDGSPRRGCEDPHCPAVKGVEQMLTPDAFARQPLSYQAMFRMRNKEYANSATSSPASSLDERTFTFGTRRSDGAVRANSTCCSSSSASSSTAPGGSRSPQSSSVHDHMCLLLNAPAGLNRAQSDEYIRTPVPEDGARKAPLSARESTNDCESTELSKAQRECERANQERRALEMMVNQLRKQLNTEKQAHENTKRELERLRTSYEKR